MAWKLPIEAPNWARSLAYWIESSRLPWASPIERAAVWARAVSSPAVVR